MTVTVRLIQPDEVGAWAQSVSVPFLDPATTEDKRVRWEHHWRPHVEIGRTWAAEDRGRFVGNACTFTRTVTLPGTGMGVQSGTGMGVQSGTGMGVQSGTGMGTQPGEAGGFCPAVPLAAVSAVGVHPTHRRRGLLRRLMAAMLDDARARGEVVAGLLASEAPIYGRFGFGPATQAATYVIDARASAFAVPAPVVDLELLTPSEAGKVLPGMFERACARQPGQVSRDEATWAGIFEDDPAERGGASARWYIVGHGGFATLRTEEISTPGDTWGKVTLRDIVAETPEIEAALWRFALDLDLVREVVAFPRPVDEPLRHRLVDPRKLRTTAVVDFLWLRVLDTPGALTARGYTRPGRLVLDVRAPAATPRGPDGLDGPDPAVGRWVLDAGADGSTCVSARADEPTDLVLGLADLGALLAGGTGASILAAAGRIDEERPGALGVADGLFASRPAPMSVTSF
jgi:predicted acetyltransferase